MADHEPRVNRPPVAQGRGSTAYPPSNGKLAYGPGESYRDSFREPYRAAGSRAVHRSEPQRGPRRRFFWPLAIILGLGLGAAAAYFTTPHGRELLKVSGQVFTPQKSLAEVFHADRVNVLLLGLDHVVEGKRDVSHRADSILVASTDFETKQIRLVSIPRDSWIPHYKDGELIREADKLGHTYIEGGVQCTKETVEQLLGVPIQYYVTINFNGFKKVIDAIGGIEVDVEKRMWYEDKWGGLTIDLQPGLQHLNGEQAMGYARFRKDLTGDVGRMGRQQIVLKKMLEKMKSPANLPRLPKLFAIFKENVETNMSMDQLLALAQNMDDYSGDGMQTMTIENYGPYDGPAYLWGRHSHQGNNMAQYLPPTGIDAAREFLNDLDPPVVEDEAAPLDERDKGWAEEGQEEGDTQ
jgi:LCP family protein required for cell wall assembly